MMIVQHHESDYLLHRAIDQFDRLYAEGEKRAKIFPLAIHAYISGQPHRIKYLEAIYDYARRLRRRFVLDRRGDFGLVFESQPHDATPLSSSAQTDDRLCTEIDGGPTAHSTDTRTQRFAITAMALAAEPCLRAPRPRPDVPCRTSGSYESWLAGFEHEAAAQGISQRAIAPPRRSSPTTRKSSTSTAASASLHRPFWNSPIAWPPPIASQRPRRGSKNTSRSSRASTSNTACPRRSLSRSGGWKAISAPTWAIIARSAPLHRSPTIAAAPTAFARSSSTRCA